MTTWDDFLDEVKSLGVRCDTPMKYYTLSKGKRAVYKVILPVVETEVKNVDDDVE